MTLPSPSACPWSRQCLIDFGAGPMPGYVERGVYGDRAYPADNTAFLAKYQPTITPYDFLPTGYAWGTVLPPVTVAQVTPPVTGTVPGPVTPWHPATPWWPSWPDGPDSPCCIVQEPDTPLPPIAPVPLPASGILLACAVGLFILRGRK
ncbi:hypothetical protein ACFOM8_02135 [Paracoccus angustae]|uniref:PEP-CTERM sorting domain-containing protein n=1 Tax=Paracoccus angustae TaxID=1671480 RepID=A0ABV7TZT4_9RHOB